MSIFTRNDKDTNAGEAPRPRENSPASAVPAAQLTEAIAQPPSNAVISQTLGVSVINKALKIKGNLESTEDIHIDGEVNGDVRGISVTIGSGAKVERTVYGDAVELAGTINGSIEAKKVVLTSTARMSGDVIHQDIRIESGAFIDGHCRPEFGKAESNNIHPIYPSTGATREQAASE